MMMILVTTKLSGERGELRHPPPLPRPRAKVLAKCACVLARQCRQREAGEVWWGAGAGKRVCACNRAGQNGG